MKWTGFMKVYFFDPDTGVYQGEGFADEAPLKRGVFVIPDHATSVGPPPYRPGFEAPFFDPDTGKWELRELSRNSGMHR